MADHKTLTDPNIHEPRGISTASAAQTYVADGEGSGNWVNQKTGGGTYSDDSIEQVFTTTPTQLIVDGLGVSTDTRFLPLDIRGTSDLWNSNTNSIDPIAVGDIYQVTVSLPISSNTAATSITLEIDAGNGVVPTDVVSRTRINTDTTELFTHSFTTSLVVTKEGSLRLFLFTNDNTVGITNPSITISRIHGEL